MHIDPFGKLSSYLTTDDTKYSFTRYPVTRETSR